jgi:hypothetical protein
MCSRHDIAHLGLPPSAPECGWPSSLSDALCILPAGHAADSPFRFHRFPEAGIRWARDRERLMAQLARNAR